MLYVAVIWIYSLFLRVRLWFRERLKTNFKAVIFASITITIFVSFARIMFLVPIKARGRDEISFYVLSKDSTYESIDRATASNITLYNSLIALNTPCDSRGMVIRFLSLSPK